MRNVRREEVKILREQYPKGTRVELVQMDDLQAPPQLVQKVLFVVLMIQEVY